MSTKEKNRQIVLLTLFAMTMVVAGHCDITPDYKNLWIFKWVYSFHMPLFFLISGFLFALTVPNVKLKTMSVSLFIKKKAIRLLIPFLFINTIIFLIKATLIKDNSLMQHPVELTLKSFLESTLISPIGFMWFLPALFVIFIISIGVRKLLLYSNLTSGQTRYLIAMILVIALFVTLDHLVPQTSFMQISSAIHYITFFLMGILYCDYKAQVDIFLRKYWFFIVPIFFLFSVSLFFKGYAAAICGCIFCITLALIIERYCPDKFVKLSGLCYTVFLLSYFPQMFIRGPIAHLFPYVNQYILSAISFVSGLLLPMIVGMIYLRLKEKNQKIDKCGILIGI